MGGPYPRNSTVRTGPSSERVVVLSDDEDLVAGLRRVLVREGYSISAAGTAVDALDQLRSDIQPRVVLVDLLAPEIDPRSFVRELASPGIAWIPVVFVSAGMVGRVLGEELHAFACIEKPFEPDHLLSVMRRAVKLQPGGR